MPTKQSLFFVYFNIVFQFFWIILWILSYQIFPMMLLFCSNTIFVINMFKKKYLKKILSLQLPTENNSLEVQVLIIQPIFPYRNTLYCTTLDKNIIVTIFLRGSPSHFSIEPAITPFQSKWRWVLWKCVLSYDEVSLNREMFFPSVY